MKAHSWKGIGALFIGILAFINTASIANSDELGLKLESALQFAEEPLANLAEEVLSSSNQFVDYSNTSGEWNIKNSSTWCSGFVPGLFWYMYDHTGDIIWSQRARAWTNGVRSRSTAADNDTGFQVFDSFGLGYLILGENNEDYLNVMRTATNTFSTQRYNPTIGSYRAWTNTSSNPVTNPSITGSTTNPNTMVFEVNIDMMMNLELPLFIGYRDSNQSYIDESIAHADRTWEDLVRSDGSTFHVVGYNSDGSVNYKRTHQGWTTDSTWSRGQAWAVYGYAMVYRYTQLPRMLERAETCFDFFVSATDAQSADAIPFSDFNAVLNSQNPRDSSAAAIVASAALELYDITDDEKYLNRATAILTNLASSEYLSEGTSYESILRKASGKWGEPEVAAIFADYFFVEASLRYLEMFPLNTSAGKLINISTRGRVGLKEDVLIAGFVIDEGTQLVAIQALGEELGKDGVSNCLVDPTLTLYDVEETELAMNDNWGDNADEAQIITDLWNENPLFDTGSKSSAIVIALPSGSYTAVVRGSNDTEGIALVEVYEID
ncbi:glycoside hydrolase family 88 protein [bacterium]|nr:glycoside hydrolase family 88 protein [bacterium]